MIRGALKEVKGQTRRPPWLGGPPPGRLERPQYMGDSPMTPGPDEAQVADKAGSSPEVFVDDGRGASRPVREKNGVRSCGGAAP